MNIIKLSNMFFGLLLKLNDKFLDLILILIELLLHNDPLIADFFVFTFIFLNYRSFLFYFLF